MPAFASLEIMLAELESHRLVVALAPCRRHVNEGGCIRVKLDQNCTWYRRFCAQYPSSRRRNRREFDTKIKRRDTERILKRLVDGKYTRSKYALELINIARRLSLKKA